MMGKTRKFMLVLCALFALPLCSALAQDEEAAPAVLGEATETSLLDVYSQGGWMMHVLLVCSIGTIAVTVYCFIQISGKKMCPQKINDSLLRNVQSKDVSNAFELCKENDSTFTRVVSDALLLVNFDRDVANKASMYEAAADTLDREETKAMQWINYLNVFATIAPMIGLLGTVTGMIASFGDLKRGASDPNDFAGGIGEAMSTTAGGLLVGIPAMFFYFFFRNRLMGIMSEVQRRSKFLIDVLSGEVKIAGSDSEEGRSFPNAI